MDIPEDIRHTALAALEDWYRRTPDDVANSVALAIAAERERCAKIAALFIIEKNSIHPDVPFERLDEQVVRVAHMTCQHIAAAIRTPLGVEIAKPAAE